MAAQRFGLLAQRLGRLGVQTGRLLEVGCGAGYGLHAFMQQGWNVTGCERNPTTAEFVRQTLGVQVVEDLAAIPGGSKFDLVLLSHLLEHIVDPAELLRTLAEYLSDGGTICVLVPNYGSVIVRLFLRHSWSGFIPLQHVWYFDRRALTRLFAVSGFEPLRLESYGFLPFRGRNVWMTAAKFPVALWQRFSRFQGDELVGLFQVTRAVSSARP